MAGRLNQTRFVDVTWTEETKRANWVEVLRDMAKNGMRRTEKKGIAIEKPVKWQDVYAIVERQGFRCALTGKPLIPGNSSIDHIIPLVRRGKHSIDNIQIVLRSINRAKGIRTNSEFLALCNSVVKYAKRKDVARANNVQGMVQGILYASEAKNARV